MPEAEKEEKKQRPPVDTAKDMALDQVKEQVMKQIAARAAAGAAGAGGSGAAAAIAAAAAPVIAVVAVVALIIILLVAIVVVFFIIFSGGGGSPPPAEAAESLLQISVTSNAPVDGFDSNVGNRNIIYTVSITNTSSETANNFVIDVDCGEGGTLVGSITPPAESLEIAAGTTGTVTYTCNIDTDPPYNDVFHSSTVTVESSFGENSETPEAEPVTTTSASGSSSTKIGDPPVGPPAFSPLKGAVRCSGSDFWPGNSFGQSLFCPQDAQYAPHKGLDIASDNFDVYSPFAGTVKVVQVGDDGDTGCVSNGRSRGVFLILETEPDNLGFRYRVEMYHLMRGSISSFVQQGKTLDFNQKLATMGNTGTSCGIHVHYVVSVSGTIVDPKVYGALKPHP